MWVKVKFSAVCCMEASKREGGEGWGLLGKNVRSGSDVEVTDCADAVEAVFKGGEGGGLGQEH